MGFIFKVQVCSMWLIEGLTMWILDIHWWRCLLLWAIHAKNASQSTTLPNHGDLVDGILAILFWFSVPASTAKERIFSNSGTSLGLSMSSTMSGNRSGSLKGPLSRSRTPGKCKYIRSHVVDLILKRVHTDYTANQMLTNTYIVSICCHQFIIAMGKCNCHVNSLEKMDHQTNPFISNHLEIDRTTYWCHLGASELFHFLVHRGSVVHGFFSMWVVNRRNNYTVYKNT